MGDYEPTGPDSDSNTNSYNDTDNSYDSYTILGSTNTIGGDGNHIKDTNIIENKNADTNSNENNMDSNESNDNTNNHIKYNIWPTKPQSFIF